MVEIPTVHPAYQKFRIDCLVNYVNPTFIGVPDHLIERILYQEHRGNLREFGYARFESEEDLTWFLLKWS